METALQLVLTNAAAAAVVAGVALVVSRVVRRPALAHALWLIALVKLVTPPLLPLPLLPAWQGLPSLYLAKAPTVVRMAPDPSSPPGFATPALRVADAHAPHTAPLLLADPPAAATAPAERPRVPSAARLRLLAAWVLGVGAVGC